MNTIRLLVGNHRPLVFALIISVLVWSLGLPYWIDNVFGAQLTLVKDTLTDSDLSVLSKHTIGWTSSNAVDAAETIKIQFDPTTSAFALAFSSATTTDITVSGMTLVTACGGGADEVTVVANDDIEVSVDEYLRFTVCSGDTVTAGAKTVTVGASTQLLTNPGVAGSYVIKVTSGATPTDTGSTRVAIIDDVVVTASVATNFTFTIAGIGSGQAINGDAVTTSAGATATALPFGELSAGAAKVLAQQLTVSTNAKNGFVVTVQQDQNLTSANGADVDLFIDGAGTAVPVAWAAPTADIALEATWGHIGVTSEDADLNSDEFGAALYAGNFSTARQVFSHTGPANGVTANKGLTKVAYKVEVSSMQEAAEDYTNTLTYIATPTF